MRAITIIEHMSLDGIIQSPGSPREDGEYAHGGWTVPFKDPTVGERILAAHRGAFDLLLGRRTYDIWADYWPTASGPFAESFRQATKVVATHRPESLRWGPVRSLGPDIVEGVRAIRSEDGPPLILWGSSSLTPVLLAHRLADEIILLVYPVLLGSGKRFFSDAAGACELALVGTEAGPTGVLVNRYHPVGALRTGSYVSPPR